MIRESTHKKIRPLSLKAAEYSLFTDKIFTENMFIDESNLHRRYHPFAFFAFPPKPDGHADIRMDISNYRVATIKSIFISVKQRNM